MLPDIKGCDVKAEGVYAPQQPPHEKQSRVRALVGLQTVGDQLNVGAKLLRLLIAVRTAGVGMAQALADLCQKYAVRHPIMAHGNAGAGARQERHVVVDARGERR